MRQFTSAQCDAALAELTASSYSLTAYRIGEALACAKYREAEALALGAWFALSDQHSYAKKSKRNEALYLAMENVARVHLYCRQTAEDAESIAQAVAS